MYSCKCIAKRNQPCIPKHLATQLFFFLSVIAISIVGCVGGESPPEDASDFDPVSSVSAIQEYAGAKAKLISIRAVGVKTNGRMNLDYKNSKSHLTYLFAISDTPVNVTITNSYWSVSQADLRSNKTIYNRGMNKSSESPKAGLLKKITDLPVCSFGDLQKTLIAKGVKINNTANVDYNRGGYRLTINGLETKKKHSWEAIKQIDSITDSSTFYFSNDCTLISAQEFSSRKESEAWNDAVVRLDTAGIQHHARDIAQSPDGKYLATAGEKGLIYVWDMESGVRIFEKRVMANDYPNGVSFTNDSKNLVYSMSDSQVYKWNFHNDTTRQFEAADFNLVNMDHSPTHPILAGAAYDKTLKRYVVVLWNSTTGKISNFLKAEGSTEINDTLHFSSDGNKLIAGRASGSGFQGIYVFETSSWQHLPEFEKPINNITASFNRVYKPQGAVLSTDGGVGYSYNNMLFVLSKKATGKWKKSFTGRHPKYTRIPPNVTSFAFSPDGKMVAVGLHTGTIRILNAENGKEIKKWRVNVPLNLGNLAFSMDNKNVVFQFSTEGTPHIWNVSNGQMIAGTQAEGGAISSLSFGKNASELASAGSRALVWNLKTKHRKAVAEKTTAICFSPDSQVVATGTKDGLVSIKNTKSTNELASWATQGKVKSLVFSKDAKYLIAATEQNLTAFEVGKPKPLWQQTANSNQVVFAPDGKTIATAENSGKIKFWNSTDGKMLKEEKLSTYPITAISYSPGGDSILTGGIGGNLVIMNINTDKSQKKTKAHDGAVTALEYSKNGKFFMTAGEDKKAKRWNVNSMEIESTYTTHESKITALSISPDNTSVATGDAAGLIQITTLNTKQ